MCSADRGQAGQLQHSVVRCTLRPMRNRFSIGLIAAFFVLSSCTASSDKRVTTQEQSASSLQVSSASVSSVDGVEWSEYENAALGLAFRYPEEAYVIEDSMDGPFPKMKLKIVEDPLGGRVFLTQEFLTFVDK